MLKPASAGLLLLALAAPLAAAEAKPAPVPFEVIKSKHIAVKVKINGKGPYRLIFDTGAPFMLVDLKTAKDSGMVAKDLRPPWFAFFNSIGPVKVKSLELGSFKLENTTVAVMDHPTVEVMARTLGPIDGLVGYPFLTAFVTTIDYQAKQFTFAPSGGPKVSSKDVIESLIETLSEDQGPEKVLAPAAQWGFTPHKPPRDDAAGVVVQAVRPGSAAAEAGLRPGDRLLTLDGRWTDSVADTFQAAGYVQPGAPVKLTVRRGEKEITVTVTPRKGL